MQISDSDYYLQHRHIFTGHQWNTAKTQEPNENKDIREKFIVLLTPKKIDDVKKSADYPATQLQKIPGLINPHCILKIAAI